MKYTTLGKTGLNVSKIGFGGIPIQRGSQKDATEAILTAFDNGINIIDSAKGYTVSEEYIGNSIHDIRSKIVLATKSPAQTYEAMKNDIETSLKNMKTDYIDVYQLHNVRDRQTLDRIMNDDGSIKALLEAKQAGKIRYIGITSHIKDTLIYAIESFSDIFYTIMYPYNIVETEGIDLMEMAHKNNIGTMAMKPLGGGNLDNIALALRFIAQNDNIDITLTGIGDKNEAQFDANLSMLPLSESEKAECEEIRKKLGTSFCRRCNYCAPCTVGIDIPSTFTMQNYLNNYDLKDWAVSRYKAMKVTADKCIGCGVCETRCPYSLPIREKLKKAAADFDKAINN